MTETRSKYQLTADEAEHLPEQVLRLLQVAQKHNARLTGQYIASQFGYRHDRQVRLAIRALIGQGYPIASSVSEPFGYFLLRDASEAEIYLHVLKSRALENFARLRDFEKAVEHAFGIPVQPALFVTEAQK